MDIAPPPLQPTPYVKPKTSGLAIASLIFGVIIIPFTILTGIPAIIMGHIAMSKIKKSQGAIGGRGLALAGTVLGYLSLIILPILAGIVTPLILRAQKSGERVEVMMEMRQVGVVLQEDRNPETGIYPASPGELPLLSNDYKGDWYYFAEAGSSDSVTSPVLVSPVSSMGFLILKVDGAVMMKKVHEFEAVMSQGEGAPVVISPAYK